MIAQEERHAHRTRWVVEKVTFFAERARMARRLRDEQADVRESVRAHPELKSTFLSVRAAEEFAAKRISNPQDRERFLELVRGAMAGSIRKGEPLPSTSLRSRSPGAVRTAETGHTETGGSDAMNSPAADPAIAEIMADQSASDWLKTALRAALERDPVDALNDTLALAGILEERLRNVSGPGRASLSTSLKACRLTARCRYIIACAPQRSQATQTFSSFRLAMPGGMRTERVGFSMRPHRAHSIHALISAGTLSLIAHYGPRSWRRGSSRVCADFHHEVSLTSLARALVRGLAPVHMSKERRRDCWTIQPGTRFSPSRPCARRCAPCSASRLRRALTAALPRALPGCPGNPARSKERLMKTEIPVCAR